MDIDSYKLFTGNVNSLKVCISCIIKMFDNIFIIFTFLNRSYTPKDNTDRLTTSYKDTLPVGCILF